MKYKIVILLALLNFISNMQAQNEVMEYKPIKDFNYKVVEYLKHNFEDRKELYVGKPLSELLKYCELPVLSEIENMGGYRYEAIGVELFFEDSETTDARITLRQELPYVYIKWSEPLSGGEPEYLSQSEGNWTPEVKAFYEKLVVGDIKVGGKNFSELPKIELEEELPAPTPCCAPEQVTGLTLEEKKTRAKKDVSK